MPRERRLYGKNAAATLASLGNRNINYTAPRGRTPDPAEGWHLDTLRHTLASEPPGAPVPGGAWEIACRLVRDYQFADPRILRALFRVDDALLGRDMLLEGRFAGLRFDMGVRVTSVVNEIRGSGTHARQVWGWGYRTLEGHLEQGELCYEVVKHLHAGTVEFLLTGYSRRAPLANPLIRTGFRLFGRPTQRRFYRASTRRLHRLTHAELHGSPPLTLHPLPPTPTLPIAPT